MRHALIGLLLTLATAMAPAHAALNISIGINVPTYPTLVRIPNYPVYYAPSLRANYFFYDGLYWVFDGDTWYESPWYNGPWDAVDSYDVPLFLLRVPVRYYRVAPAYFRGWAYDAPPRWGDHWGASWVSRRSGWDRWNRASAPAPAPLPAYQRSYSGSRYPTSVSQQAAIQTRSYTYAPRDSVAVRTFQQRRSEARTAPQPTAVAPPQQRIETNRARVVTTPQQHEHQQQQAQRQQEHQQQQAQRQQEHQQQQAQRQQEHQQQQAERQEAHRQQQAQAQQQRENRGQERGNGHDNGGGNGKGRDKDKD